MEHLREELELLSAFLAGAGAQTSAPDYPAGCHSDFHLPGTFRGGFVAQLQRLLILNPDGSVRAAHGPKSVNPG